MRLISGDWHCDPPALRPAVKLWLARGMRWGDDLYGNGDLFNDLPWGQKHWETFRNSKDELERTLNGYPFTYLTGNHDPDEEWIKWMFEDSPNITVVNEIDLDGVNIRHGHDTFIDWAILGHFAPEVVNFLSRHFPTAWYEFSVKMGWLPSTFVGTDTYHKVVLGVWRSALKYAQAHDCRVVRNHTHHEAILYEPEGFVLADGGTLGGDGTYLEWGEQMRLKNIWLKGVR